MKQVFNKAIELNKDKKFTFEDMKIAFEAGEGNWQNTNPKQEIVDFYEFMNDFQKPKSYNCEYEVESICSVCGSVCNENCRAFQLNQPLLINGFLHVKIIK